MDPDARFYIFLTLPGRTCTVSAVSFGRDFDVGPLDDGRISRDLYFSANQSVVSWSQTVDEANRRCGLSSRSYPTLWPHLCLALACTVLSPFI